MKVKLCKIMLLTWIIFFRANPTRPGDYKEAFDISGDACFVPGIEWPDRLVPEFSLTMKNFMKTCKQLALRVLTALSYGMKLKVSGKIWFFRLNLHLKL